MSTFFFNVITIKDIFELEKAYNTRCSQAVTHLSTNQAQRSLSSEIERDREHSTWYGRKRMLVENSSLKMMLQILWGGGK